MNSNPFTAQTYHSELNELTVTYQKNQNVKNQKIIMSKDTYELAKALWPVDINHREAMIAFYLNRANHTVGYSIISIGSISGTTCDPRIVFQLALLTNASSVIIAHNHPSGNLSPSQADKNLTANIKEIGKILDIPLVDHIILTDEGYFSFADRGLL